MRIVAVLLSLALSTPPESDPTLDQTLEDECVGDECDGIDLDAVAVEPTGDADAPTEPPTEAPESADTGPSAEELKAEELKTEARGLAADGEHRRAIEIYRQAYQIAPGDHIIAYLIAESAMRIGDCSTAKIHLRHFITYADPATFPNKLAQAERDLDALKHDPARCRGATREVGEASRAGAPVRLPGSQGNGLAAGGAVMLVTGIIGTIAGIALVAVGLTGTKKEAMSLTETPDLEKIAKYRRFAIGGAISGPCGVAFIAGGSVMIARSGQAGYVTISPTGLSVRF